MTARSSALFALALAASVAACSHRTAAAPGGAAAADSTPRPPRAARADRNSITRERILQDGVAQGTLYDYVSTRHPEWMRSSASGSLRVSPVTIYVDGVRFGTEPSAMRGIALSNVYLARRLSPSEAEGKYGTDNNGGTIEVFTSLERVR